MMSSLPSIIIVEDDPVDWTMIGEAFEDAGVENPVIHLLDGVALLKHLRDPATDKPGLILLDLNMPKLNGFETLQCIRADPALRHLVVVIMTTSHAEVDVFKSYNNGANSYIVKPLTFKGLVEAITVIEQYWVKIVSLPKDLDTSLSA